MKKLLVVIAALLLGAGPSLAQKTKAQINTEITTLFPDNAGGQITPLGLRTVTADITNSILPTAPVVSGNLACFNGTTGLLQDCGVAPGVTIAIGTTTITGGSSTNVLYNNAGKVGEYTITGSGSVAMSVAPTISNINLTGTPTGSASATTVNGQTCTLGSTCTITASAGTITPGTTTISSGTDKGLLYDNAGTLGNLATANSGVLITSGAGVPSISTTLPSGLSIGSPTLTGTVGGSGVIPSAVLANTAVSASSYGSSTSIPSFTVNAQGQLTAASGNVVIAPAGTLTGTTLAANVVTSSLTSVGTLATGVWNGSVIGLTYGGTNNALSASNGGVVYSDASKLNILSGTVTAGQCLLSGSSAAPTWGSCAGGATVTNIAGNTGAFTLAAGITNSTNSIQQDGNYSGWALQNCTIAASVSANVLTVSLKDNAGSNPSSTSPCNINYRNVTAATGSTTLVSQTSSLSVDTNTTGATLGSANSNTPFRFWVVAFNNSGTNALALINCTGSGQNFPLDESALSSSTAMSGSATSAGIFYTQNGTTVTSKAFRILGYVEYGSGLATAGTYASGPTIIQTFGAGIKKPGEVVQRLSAQATGTTTTSSAGPVASALAKNFTKTSSANSVRMDVSLTGLTSANVGSGFTVTPYRGNAACTTSLGNSSGGNTGSAIAILIANSVAVLDSPASSGSTTAQYTICFSALNSFNVTVPYLTNFGNMVLEEIQG